MSALPGTARTFPPLHVVTDDPVLRRADFPAIARALLETGGPALALHLRGPRTPGGRIEALGAELARARGGSDAWLVVNDRVDVAAVVGADGVQLGRRSLSVAAAQRVAPRLRVGVSVHGRAEVAEARGADWLVAGTIWPTPSHPGRDGGGRDHLAALVAAAAAPVVAIGGVTPERVAEVRAAGAAGIAVIRGVWEAPDPLAALDAYLSAWRHA